MLFRRRTTQPATSTATSTREFFVCGGLSSTFRHIAQILKPFLGKNRTPTPWLPNAVRKRTSTNKSTREIKRRIDLYHLEQLIAAVSDPEHSIAGNSEDEGEQA